MLGFAVVGLVPSGGRPGSHSGAPGKPVVYSGESLIRRPWAPRAANDQAARQESGHDCEECLHLP